MDEYTLLALAVEEGILPGRARSTSVQPQATSLEHCVHCNQPIAYESSVGEWVVNDGGCDSSPTGTHEPF